MTAVIMPHPETTNSIKPKHTVYLWAALLGWLMSFGLTPLVSAGDASPEPAARSKNYFTQQPADTPLVIRMNAFETEFESRVFDPKNIQLKASGVPAQRLGAVYQFIEAVSKPRQLRIEVAMGRSTNRSKLDMQVTLFDP